MIVQDLNFDQTVAMAKAKAESMIQNGLYSAQLQISVAYFCSIGLYFLV